ncbi:hypothetical protein RHGRI_028979 [Rhododendron griersonianum]|uniref:Uncharacterized protein n=1 Tax=Rhododendron griersonianum TaxID=479676 RepID=A0AAV6IHT4_9ERIC|nr:hypothetical protein RHGRI_028979 [Rhododendron griersonianum]
MYSCKPKSPFDPPPPSTQHQQAPYRLSISGTSPLHHCTTSPVELGKQMRSDVRIKNTSSSHVASSPLLHVPETGSHDSESGSSSRSDSDADDAESRG